MAGKIVKLKKVLSGKTVNFKKLQKMSRKVLKMLKNCRKTDSNKENVNKKL